MQQSMKLQRVRHDLATEQQLTEQQLVTLGLPWWLSGKNSPASAGDRSSISRPGRFPEGGNVNPLQYS